jgi:hypothetical protein
MDINADYTRELATSINTTWPNLEEALRDYDMADTVYERISEQIKVFQDDLDDEHEVGVMLASFGQLFFFV